MEKKTNDNRTGTNSTNKQTNQPKLLDVVDISLSDAMAMCLVYRRFDEIDRKTKNSFFAARITTASRLCFARDFVAVLRNDRRRAPSGWDVVRSSRSTRTHNTTVCAVDKRCGAGVGSRAHAHRRPSPPRLCNRLSSCQPATPSGGRRRSPTSLGSQYKHRDGILCAPPVSCLLGPYRCSVHVTRARIHIFIPTETVERNSSQRSSKLLLSSLTQQQQLLLLLLLLLLQRRGRRRRDD